MFITASLPLGATPTIGITGWYEEWIHFGLHQIVNMNVLLSDTTWNISCVSFERVSNIMVLTKS